MGLWVSCNITVSGIFLCEMMGWKWDCAISEHLGPFYQDRVPSWRVGTGKTCSGSSVMGPWSEGPWSVWPPVLDSCLVVGFSLPNPAAAAAKSLQSCLTLWNPIDGSPPGSPIPGILVGCHCLLHGQILTAYKWGNWGLGTEITP